MPFQNGVVFQASIVAASWVVAKSVFNPSGLQHDIQTVLEACCKRTLVWARVEHF